MEDIEDMPLLGTWQFFLLKYFQRKNDERVQIKQILNSNNQKISKVKPCNLVANIFPSLLSNPWDLSHLVQNGNIS